MPIEEICLGLPENMLNVLRYVTNLDHNDDPDYLFISKQFKYMPESNII